MGSGRRPFLRVLGGALLAALVPLVLHSGSAAEECPFNGLLGAPTPPFRAAVISLEEAPDAGCSAADVKLRDLPLADLDLVLLRVDERLAPEDVARCFTRLAIAARSKRADGWGGRIGFEIHPRADSPLGYRSISPLIEPALTVTKLYDIILAAAVQTVGGECLSRESAEVPIIIREAKTSGSMMLDFLSGLRARGRVVHNVVGCLLSDDPALTGSVAPHDDLAIDLALDLDHRLSPFGHRLLFIMANHKLCGSAELTPEQRIDYLHMLAGAPAPDETSRLRWREWFSVRPPDRGGWVQLLIAGPRPGAAAIPAVRQIAQLREDFARTTVRRWYWSLLLRPLDGLRWDDVDWIDRRVSQMLAGVSGEDIMLLFAETPEFTSGPKPAAESVRRLFESLQGRLPTESEVDRVLGSFAGVIANDPKWAHRYLARWAIAQPETREFTARTILSRCRAAAAASGGLLSAPRALRPILCGRRERPNADDRL